MSEAVITIKDSENGEGLDISIEFYPMATKDSRTPAQSYALLMLKLFNDFMTENGQEVEV